MTHLREQRIQSRPLGRGPAGILTLTLREHCSLPDPRHWGQGSATMEPVPWHRVQVLTLANRPKMLC
jgi:hypothetical protein